MSEVHSTIAMGLPYKTFKEKIRFTKHFEKYYHVQDFPIDLKRGVLYMERKMI